MKVNDFLSVLVSSSQVKGRSKAFKLSLCKPGENQRLLSPLVSSNRAKGRSKAFKLSLSKPDESQRLLLPLVSSASLLSLVSKTLADW